MASAIAEQTLLSEGWHPTREALQNLQALGEDVDAMREVLLNADLHEVGAPALPDNVNR
eukprot:CAMPEP_0114268708 /NCGR_PEP_ID=MMETSP0058-20121206/26140_1 /TAXON_ID=36894 /ORGANISM="Pyramimonas parkeae, CCMP726" /LENGTH=58 /DNA_ID=CAMNT_0001386979 /DNA_START=51 /DNA_END=224 /DNA_ORIENTATION=+